MKIAYLFCIFILSSCLCRAQYVSVDKPIYKIIKRDTINIRGIVYDALNKPVPHIILQSKNKELIYSGYYIYTITDTAGRFILKGALVKDTLSFLDISSQKIINNGSRYLEIHLPEQYAVNPVNPSAEVTAKRKVKKQPLPTFKVLTNASILDYYGVSITTDAEFWGGAANFTKYVRNKTVYPEKAIENNIEGDVEIGFTIEKDGTLSNYKIIRGIGYGCDDAVIDALRISPKWRPAIINSRHIASQSSITIQFKLIDN